MTIKILNILFFEKKYYDFLNKNEEDLLIAYYIMFVNV